MTWRQVPPPRSERWTTATCQSCAGEVPDRSRFCLSCGAAIETPTSAPTETSLKSQPSPASQPTPDQARFIPGTVLAKRYRIVGLLGRGGMGEVYRADDLKLGQPVALKFLPSAVQRDRARLDRFLNEVKVALKVTHPNVCRVYDIGEVDGQHYISMEYVDGEDLASLLRRIGRLPQDRAVQIARQLCAGLAAAHQEGILHRDLKPSNVMIDGRGRARITDFGLASLATSIEGEEVRAGTPAYMAPEQLDGKEVSVKSDLYALGLVLYELFTGKRAFEAAGPAEIRKLQEESSPTSPSSHVDGLDPAVERIILRCLEREPAQRPPSALSVTAALPGGDPLATALAAGETPSPEMVAGAGGEGVLRPAVAGSLLVTILVGLVVVFFAQDQFRFFRQVPLPKPPPELTLAAREIVEMAGYDEPPVHRVFGFELDEDYVYSQDHDPTENRWSNLATVRPSPIWFWYRQSPRYIVPANYFGYLTASDPPSIDSGMIDVRLDPSGKLLRFQAVPPEHDESQDRGEPEWGDFFERAGLDFVDFDSVDFAWVPLVSSDVRRAWAAGSDDGPLRVEAGSFRGRPVYFEVIPHWRVPQRMESQSLTTAQRIVGNVFVSFGLGVILGGILLVRRNLRLGRGDRRGALRLAAFMSLVEFAKWILEIDHVPTGAEFGLVQNALAWALLVGAVTWMFYMALEPYARRLWPDALIAWKRLLDGKLRDPLVGAHVIVGGVFGVGMALLSLTMRKLPDWLGGPQHMPVVGPLQALHGWSGAAAAILGKLSQILTISFFGLLAIVLLRIVLRRQWAVVLVLMLMGALVVGATSNSPPIYGAFGALTFLIVTVVLLRFGLLTLIALFAFSAWSQYLVTADPSTWYFDRALATLLLFILIACYAFYTSLGGRPLFQDAFLEKSK